MYATMTQTCKELIIKHNETNWLIGWLMINSSYQYLLWSVRLGMH